MSASCGRELAYQQGLLCFFNQVLLEEGLITEEDYQKMKLKIQTRSGENARQGVPPRRASPLRPQPASLPPMDGA